MKKILLIDIFIYKICIECIIHYFFMNGNKNLTDGFTFSGCRKKAGHTYLLLFFVRTRETPVR